MSEENSQIKEEPIYATEKGENLYLLYVHFMKLCNVRRMGVAKCGSNGRPTTKRGLRKLVEPFFGKNREESDGEHVYGTVVLTSLLPDYYPDKFPKETEQKYFSTMLYHELGEGASGDIPADGTRDDEVQDQKELNYVKNLLDNYATDKARNEKMPLYRDFLEQKDVVGRNSFLIDKFEAILFNLFLEQQGRPGSISWRTKHFGQKLSKDQGLTDEEIAEITGSDLPADNWLCRLLITNPEVMSYPAFEVFREIVQSAAVIVRGEEMKWLNEYHYKKTYYTP